MLIFLYGQDSYRSRRKLKEIIENYQAKHKSGLDFVVFKEDLDWQKIKQKIEAVSMFDEKKLIVIENAFSSSLEPDIVIDYCKKHKMIEEKEVVMVFWHEGVPDKRGKLYKFLTKKPIMSQEFKVLAGFYLENWIKKEVTQHGGQIESAAVKKLAWQVGSDLWQMTSEINKLIAYTSGSISAKAVDELVKARLDLNIFETVDALGQRNKKKALELIHYHLEQGESELYLFSMLAYQFRNMIKIKSLLEEGVPVFQIAQQASLHPFVVKKTSAQVRNFSLEQLKEIYRLLLKKEVEIKNGQIEPRLALDTLVAGI